MSEAPQFLDQRWFKLGNIAVWFILCAGLLSLFLIPATLIAGIPMFHLFIFFILCSVSAAIGYSADKHLIVASRKNRAVLEDFMDTKKYWRNRLYFLILGKYYMNEPR